MVKLLVRAVSSSYVNLTFIKATIYPCGYEITSFSEIYEKYPGVKLSIRTHQNDTLSNVKKSTTYKVNTSKFIWGLSRQS